MNTKKNHIDLNNLVHVPGLKWTAGINPAGDMMPTFEIDTDVYGFLFSSLKIIIGIRKLMMVDELSIISDYLYARYMNCQFWKSTLW